MLEELKKSLVECPVVKKGDYFLSAAPIKIKGAEAAPVRAFLVSDFIFWSGDNKK